MRAALFCLALLALLPTACRTDPAPAAPAASQELDPEPVAVRTFEALSRAGTYRVRWSSAEGAIPLNETFELRVEVERADDATPVRGAEVIVNAAMPDHGHGMLREPRSSELADGTYRVEGMLLHMTGYWQVFVDVIDNGVAETADFELTLE